MRIALDKKGEEYLETVLAMSEENNDASEFFNYYLSLPIKEKRKVELGARRLQPESYRNNPYFKLLSSLKGRKGNISYEMDHYEPNEKFLYKEIESSPLEAYREINPYGFFPSRFDYPAIKENGTTWMSLIPHEMHTMEQGINEARGNVLTLGLGLGYYAYMVALKKEVSRVDVVEKDKNVIALFKENILPKIPFKNKINIIEGDAFEALEKEKVKPHDYVYFDIYHTEEDALPLYIKGKRIIDAPYIHYWIEGSILVYFRRYVTLLLLEEADGSSDEDYQDGDEFADHVFYRLHSILKDVELKNEKDIKDLLSEENLKRLIKAI
ncbi:MAG: hypothetical protein MJ239_05840 [Bacilli bacterium]|nr:hypothetical protein [Bacilli bacterium]